MKRIKIIRIYGKFSRLGNSIDRAAFHQSALTLVAILSSFSFKFSEPKRAMFRFHPAVVAAETKVTGRRIVSLRQGKTHIF